MERKKTLKNVEPKPEEKGQTLNRRDFFKIGATTAAVGAVGVAAIPNKAASKSLSEEIKKQVIKEHDEFPNKIREDYKPHASYSTVHGHGFFGEPLKALGVDVDPDAWENGQKFIHHTNYEYEKGKKGYDQLSKAVEAGGWALANFGSGPMPGGVPDFGMMSWDNNEDKYPLALMGQDFVQKEKYEFESEEFAANAIKRAARLFGADLVGITKRDKKWDYSVNFNPVPPTARKISPMGPRQFGHMLEVGGEAMKAEMDSHTPDKWLYELDDAAGFVPKSVIVMGFEMDYEAFTTAPSCVASAAAGEGYSRMTKVAHQMAVFMRQIGYNAIPAGNDTGLSIPYAIAAGIGEGSRMGTIVTYKYGPRVRIAKVYTDFDFVKYDKPKTFGVFEFCKRCKRCADSCPAEAISYDEEPSFEPTHENKDNAYFNAVGTEKWYMDAKKCFKTWADLGNDCGACISACPYNKPDFWHHRLVDSISAAMPGPVHSFMREMDIAFGYGNIEDEGAVDKFYDPKGREYNGH